MTTGYTSHLLHETETTADVSQIVSFSCFNNRLNAFCVFSIADCIDW